MILHNNLTVSSIAHNPELLVVIQNFIQENQFDVDFSKLMKLVTGISDFDVSAPHLNHLEGIHAFELLLDDLLPDRTCSESEFERLNNIEKQADYYYFTPYGIYAVFALEALLEAIKTDNSAYRAECLDICKKSSHLAFHQETLIDVAEKLHESFGLEDLKLRKSNSANKNSHLRKLALQDYVAEAVVFAWCKLELPNTNNISYFITTITSQDHSGILKPYFERRQAEYKDNKGALILSDELISEVIRLVLRFLKKHSSDESVAKLPSSKDKKNSPLNVIVRDWVKRQNSPDYSAILDVAAKAVKLRNFPY